MWDHGTSGLTSDPCHQQFVQVQDQPAQMWNQAQAALSKAPPLQMSLKQAQHPQTYFMAPQDPLKLYEPPMGSPGQTPLSNIDKKTKFPNVTMQDFYWEPSYQMGDGHSVLSERMKSPVAVCPEPPPGPRGPFEVSWAEVQVVRLSCSFCRSAAPALVTFQT